MNGSNLEKVVVDTNIIFMALYNPYSKAGEIINTAFLNKIKLFSTDSVKEEIIRVLKHEMNLSDIEINKIILSLPITWINKEIYINQLKNTKVKHKPDKPIEALAITLNCGILSGDKHFKNRMDINILLRNLINKQ